MAKIPTVNFIEQSNGVLPIVAGVRNRVIVIGEFDRGPTSPTFISGYTDFAKRYGSSPDKNGSLGLQTVFEQGATNIAACRVLGNEQRASNRFAISGVSTNAPGTNYDSQQLYLEASVIGGLKVYPNTVLRSVISTSGHYTGSTSSIYHFLVATGLQTSAVEGYVLKDAVGPTPAVTVDIPANSWLIKYKVTDLTQIQLTESDFVDATDYVLVTFPSGAPPLSTQAIVIKTVGIEGLKLTFHLQTALDLVAGQQFSVQVLNFNDAFTPIDISPNTSNEILFNLIQEAWQGTDPIGRITLDPGSYASGAIGASVNYAGTAGNRIVYRYRFAVPDAIVPATVRSVYQAGSPATYILILDEANLTQAQYIRPGATVSDGGTNIVESPSATVLSVNTSTGEIVLDGGFTTSQETAFTVTFTNTTGIEIAQVASDANGYSAFSGGIDGPVYGRRTLYTAHGRALVRLVAVSPGVWSSGLSISINNTATPGKFLISITDGNADKFDPSLKSEVFAVTLTNFDKTTGELLDLRSSYYVRAFFVPVVTDSTNYDAALLYDWPQRLLPPVAAVTSPRALDNPAALGTKILTGFNLLSGSDGPEITDDDYYRALDAAKSIPVHIVVCPGITSNGVRAAMITHAESSNELEGLRIVVLQASRYLTPEKAKAEVLPFNSSRATMVVGWGTYRSSKLDYGTYNLPLDATLAGRLAALPFYVSPAARRSSGEIPSVYAMDTDPYANYSTLQVFADSNLEIAALDPSTNGYYFYTGAALTSNTEFDHISYRRTYDVIRMDLYDNLQQYKSEPLTSTLASQIVTSINAYMNNRLTSGQIGSYPSNGTQIVATSEPNTIAVSVTFGPLGSADTINIFLIRQASGQVLSV